MLRILTLSLVALASLPAATLTVGVENIHYYPHYTVDQEGQWAGFGRALLDRFAGAHGHTLVYKPMPVARLFKTFVGGGVDLKYPDNAYWSSDIKEGYEVVYSAPVVAYIDGVSVLNDHLGQPLDGFKRLGLVRGFTAWAWQDLVTAGTVKTTEVADFTQLCSLGLKGRVDGIYGNVAVLQHTLTETLREPGALVFDPSLPHTQGHYHLSTIAQGEVIAQFNAWLESAAAEITALKQEYHLATE